ncbi:iron-containing redox enzyme family protein, partial [Pseudomonas syringae pv. tagetis]
HGLIRTFLDDLGDGEQAQNHVSLYLKLLADLVCDTSAPLTDDDYLQGAIQLSLGNITNKYIPKKNVNNKDNNNLPI